MKLLKLMVLLLLCSNVQAQSLKVMSYNIKYDNTSDTQNNWNDRKEFLLSQLNYYHPDIIGTQEGLHHQLEAIKEALPYYDYLGIGRDNGDTAGEFSAIFYNKEVLEVKNKGNFWLSPTPEVPSKGWDAALNRICTYALFENKTNGKTFWMFNIHFDHQGKVAREESSKLILRKIKQLNTQGLPVVLSGDFNLTADEKGVQLITEELIDTHIAAGANAFGPEGTYNGFAFDKPVKDKIDYVFISKTGFEVLKSGILSDSKDCKYPSDHFPVLVDLKFK